MSDCMTFPDTVEEFMERYKVVDTDGIYMSKGAELVPIFRMRQWFEHLPSAQPDVPNINVGDMISRQAAIDEIKEIYEWHDNVTKERIIEHFVRLPSAQPEPKKGKWIVHPEVKNVYGGTYIECSQCGEKYVVQHMEDEKYCRNCGAKMEGHDE